MQEAAQTGGLTSISDVVALGERNGVAVYEINGLKDQRLFGFIPVTTPVTVIVYQSLLILHTFYQKMSLRMVIPVANSFASGISAETGQTVSQEQSILSNIVDFLSF